ncbi:outer membrane beta-barrel domain-containing protein [Marinibactrum halimedae]|uniref:Outer membrane protein beta-barrel domain-containing protein n=1 Tax=Marinibactrum halimedae TaxID=1444977 RepID=A0AA37T2D8_9GAMM|nr:outer membrane beta-barrel domain-containing protein [Marinibactrum halimedae]MCD9457777.1 outer membrane beta-barrel domain-containing protein [Marinibactrum halimedae]GLS24849.1 hypothetical protein GCM10007877_05630 [Marinibactrum halimedae]
MENWLNRILLSATTAGALLIGGQVSAQDRVLDQIITPDLERREIKEDKIDNEDFEVGLFAGVMNVEDFGSNDVVGIRLAYHISEDLFIETSIGDSRLKETSFERLSGDIQILTEDQRELIYYNLSLGYNFLPGEVFVGSKWAFNTNLYLIGGAGSTSFADEEHFTYNLGGGINFFATDWFSIRWDVRAHLFEHDIFGEEQDTTNLETSLGLNIYF